MMTLNEFEDVKAFAKHAIAGILANNYEGYSDDEMCLAAWSYAMKMVKIDKVIQEKEVIITF